MTIKKDYTMSEKLIVAHWIEEGRKSAKNPKKRTENYRKLGVIPRKYQRAFRQGLAEGERE